MTPKEILTVAFRLRHKQPHVAGVYLIYCAESERGYFGSSADVYQRLSYHKAYLRRGSHDNEHLQRAYAKYGDAAFQFLTVAALDPAAVTPQALIDLENVYLLGCDRSHLYNMQIPATIGGVKGFKHSQKTKEKMRLTHQNLAKSGVVHHNKGRKWSIEQKEAQSERLKGTGRGENNAMAKHTWEKIRSMRADYDSSNLKRGLISKIAEKYGINRRETWAIVKRINWKE